MLATQRTALIFMTWPTSAPLGLSYSLLSSSANHCVFGDVVPGVPGADPAVPVSLMLMWTL